VIKVILVAGARPNFMKIAPIIRAMDKHGGYEVILVHTGQHYDEKMSKSFFSTLGIPEPQYNLEVGSGSHAYQTAEVMVRFESVCVDEKPDLVLVVGDVNSTIAAGLVAKKLQIKLAHVEAGLRSRDNCMPEEINRLATDAISDIFFTTEKNASDNLIAEGHKEGNIHFVGHVMIDNLYYQLNSLSNNKISQNILGIKAKINKSYICLTLHRPSNVDSSESLGNIINGVAEIAKNFPVIFPCHPRTREKLSQFSLDDLIIEYDETTENICSGIILVEPLAFDDFLYLWKDSLAVITDSGGLQEETSALGVPCLTIRENTERPITIDIGTNVLIGSDMKKLKDTIVNIKNENTKDASIPALWDGKAADRIVTILARETK